VNCINNIHFKQRSKQNNDWYQITFCLVTEALSMSTACPELLHKTESAVSWTCDNKPTH